MFLQTRAYILKQITVVSPSPNSSLASGPTTPMLIGSYSCHSSLRPPPGTPKRYAPHSTSSRVGGSGWAEDLNCYTHPQSRNLKFQPEVAITYPELWGLGQENSWVTRVGEKQTGRVASRFLLNIGFLLHSLYWQVENRYEPGLWNQTAWDLSFTL